LIPRIFKSTGKSKGMEKRLSADEIVERIKEIAWKAEEKEIRRLERIIKLRVKELSKKLVE
jgi:hypothetical protein